MGLLKAMRRLWCEGACSTVQHLKQIQQTLDYIETQLKGPLSLQILARVAAFSPYHFHRVFQALVGEPVMEYVRRRRLSEAGQELLTNPGKRTLDLALEYQFSSQEAFIRAFRRSFGMTPGEFRRHGRLVPLREPAKLDVRPQGAVRPIRRQRRPILRRVHAAFLQVRNLKQSAQWYQDRLGLQFMYHWGRGSDFRVFNDETMLTLIQADRVTPAHFLDFRAHDLMATYSRLQESGVPVSEIIDGEVVKTFSFADPDGNRFDVWYQEEERGGLPRPAHLFDRVDSVFMPVRNLDRAVNWYCQKLGLRLLHHWDQGADLEVGTGQTLLTLLKDLEMRPQVLPDDTMEMPHFHFQSTAIQRTHRLLSNRGVQVTGLKEYDLVWCFHFRDPDGNLLGVCYEKPPSPFYNR